MVGFRVVMPGECEVGSEDTFYTQLHKDESLIVLACGRYKSIGGIANIEHSKIRKYRELLKPFLDHLEDEGFSREDGEIKLVGRRDDIDKVLGYIGRRGYKNVTSREREIDPEDDSDLIGNAYVLSQLKKVAITTNKDRLTP
jgi:hypothetical protein